jgi:PHD/YefM family antitoxin component YafN of YafNO toxin-antitoxin module
MYSTTGIQTIATITELRSKTSELLDYIRDNRATVLIQKNNEAYAVLVDWDTYQELMSNSDRGSKTDRKG